MKYAILVGTMAFNILLASLAIIRAGYMFNIEITLMQSIVAAVINNDAFLCPVNTKARR